VAEVAAAGPSAATKSLQTARGRRVSGQYDGGSSISPPGAAVMPLALARLLHHLHRRPDPAPDAALLERFARHRDEAAFPAFVPHPATGRMTKAAYQSMNRQ
jgi:hypothetical protein